VNDNQFIRPSDERNENLTFENASPALQERAREITAEARSIGNEIPLDQSVRQAAHEQDTLARQAVDLAAKGPTPVHEMTWAELHPPTETTQEHKHASAHKQEHGYGHSF
jgi:hypothetical protein